MNLKLNDIVVTGFSAITAAGTGIERILEFSRSGTNALTPVPADITGDTGLLWGKAAGFKATDFIPPLKARKMDRCSHFAVAVAGLALKDAGIDLKSARADRIGIALGCGFAGVANSAEFLTGYFSDGADGMSPMLFPNTVANAPASNASIELGLKGPNLTQVQRFCSAESAFMMACRFISEGRADVMLTGGVDDLIPLMIKGFKSTGQLHRYASNFGEGCGILVLESAAHASARGANQKGRVNSIRTIGQLIPGHEQAGFDLLLNGLPLPSLLSVSGASKLLPEFKEYFGGTPLIDTGNVTGSSLAMGGTAMSALIASLANGQQGVHLAASPEGPYFAVHFTGGSTV